jgi:hypothetical protein
VFGHEVDGFRRRQLRRNDEVALVLPLFVIDQDDHPAVAKFLDSFLDRRKRLAGVAGYAQHVHFSSCCRAT